MSTHESSEQQAHSLGQEPQGKTEVEVLGDYMRGLAVNLLEEHATVYSYNPPSINISPNDSSLASWWKSRGKRKYDKEFFKAPLYHFNPSQAERALTRDELHNFRWLSRNVLLENGERQTLRVFSYGEDLSQARVVFKRYTEYGLGYDPGHNMRRGYLIFESDGKVGLWKRHGWVHPFLGFQDDRADFRERDANKQDLDYYYWDLVSFKKHFEGEEPKVVFDAGRGVFKGE